ncbi:unnamed protein product [Ectocarpus sp. 8 AP-2014]
MAQTSPLSDWIHHKDTLKAHLEYEQSPRSPARIGYICCWFALLQCLQADPVRAYLQLLVARQVLHRLPQSHKGVEPPQHLTSPCVSLEHGYRAQVLRLARRDELNLSPQLPELVFRKIEHQVVQVVTLFLDLHEGLVHQVAQQ